MFHIKVDQKFSQSKKYKCNIFQSGDAFFWAQFEQHLVVRLMAAFYGGNFTYGGGKYYLRARGHSVNKITLQKL